MENEEKKPEIKRTNYIQKTLKIFLKIVLFLVLLVVVLFLLLLTPPVQRFATTKVESFLQNKLKTEVEIGRIAFGLSGKISLKDVYIEDQTKDTLLSGGAIKARLSLMKLFSNEVEVTNVALEDITAKIKRILPDTVFNFQFITDAFISENTKDPDTAQTAPLKLNVYKIDLDNIHLVYKDVITGNDMRAYIGDLTAKIDTLDIYQSHFTVPLIDASNVIARINQTKPLVQQPDDPETDKAEAAAPVAMKLNFGTIDLEKIDVQYANDVSAFYTQLNVGKLKTTGKAFDMQNSLLHLNELTLNNTVASVRMGNTEQTKLVKKEVAQEAEAQAQNNWKVYVDNIELNDNQIVFDDDTKPKASGGMDFAHLNGDSITLHLKNFVMSPDSIGVSVTKGYFREKSGFRLDALEGDILYASNQTYLKDFYVKTPGTELKRNVVLTYPSFKALTDSMDKIQMDIDIPDSYVQVKDILAFAPQLRSQPAFSQPDDVWHLDLQASGNMDRLHIAALQFSGLRNTVIEADGTLSSITDANRAGGSLYIRRFHTTPSDIEFLSGQKLPAAINLPSSINIRGTIAGNAKKLNTNLNVATSAGSLAVAGKFTNLTNPAAATYDASLKTNGLQVGSILSNPQMGAISAAGTASGKGFTPDAINTKFRGSIFSFGFNNYTYRNIHFNGSLRKNVFDAVVDANDPNLALNLKASGNFSETPAFAVHGFVDSVKTLPLHFTTQPIIFRGQIDADIPSADPNNLEADVLISKALLVMETNRIPLDSVQLLAGRSDTGQYLRLVSNFARAQLTGQYRLTDLGTIIQNNIEPYFSVAPSPAAVNNIPPYDISFLADVQYSPILAAFVPGLKAMEPVHAEGRLATGQGLQATVTTPYILMEPNEINDVRVNVYTNDSGMHVRGNVGRLKSGNSFDVYNTDLTAKILNNNVDFGLRVRDQNNNSKYRLAGLFTQPSPGTMTISLHPDSLMLNYALWNVPADNAITITNEQIIAENFVLQKDNQKLSVISAPGSGIRPLDVSFANFRIATITGFIKSDSLLVDGAINGSAQFKNLMQQPVFTSDLTVSDLSFKQDTIGNINLKVNSSGDNYISDISITGRGNDIRLTGSFAPQGADDIALDLALAIRKLELSTLEGLMGTFITNASGAITGDVTIKGTTSQPKIRGALNFDTASITTLALGGPLRIDDEKISVSENGFDFDKFTIRDSADNALTIDGTVQTVNFINYAFSLDVDAQNFKAVSTTKKPNSIYYGDLIISTNLHIGGTEQKPIVDGSLSINEDTDFSIVLPQAEPGVVARDGVVEFVDLDAPNYDSLFFASYDSLNTSGLMGFDISTNITIDKKATFNIIVDVANGDFLNVKGAGELSAGIDPSGKISLTGSYEIEEGAYQLSFNFLQRKFTIQQGSKITWLGDPTHAQVDVTAVYVANTAPLDLVEGQITDQTQRNYYLQKLPFQVLLKLTGELMKPVISFDVLLPPDKNYNVSNDVVSNVNIRLAQLRQEPSELNKQVFAVLLLNRFVGQNPFQSSAGGGFNAGSFARQSVSKLLTEQLNKLAGDLVAGIDINFDVASTDDYTTGERRNRTDLNVGLSKKLLNDRLTVTVGSNFQLEGPQQANQASNNIAGNVSVNYQLSKDGRYMMRFYRKNDYEGTVDGYVIETGLGFIMTVDYNRFREILHAKKIREEREKRAQQRNQNNIQNQ